MLAIVGSFEGAFLDDHDTHARRQLSNGSREIEVFVVHYEPKNRPARTAPETMKALSLRADVKRRRLLLVERAERFETRPGALQGKVGPDDFDDIVRRSHLLDRLGCDCHFVLVRLWAPMANLARA